jgi:hypothetical protein
MAETDCLGIGPEEERKLKTSVESTCELCGNYTPLSLLEIHLISRRQTKKEVRDPSLRILVACPLCHYQLHAIPVPVKLQRLIAGHRNFFIRRDLRNVLGYKPKPYTPPEDQDIPAIYEDYKNFPNRLSG